MWVIVGLGNPGAKYVRTRHNMGFHCIIRLAHHHGLEFTKKRSQAHVAEGHIAGQRVALVKPMTYMNLSGQAVSSLRSWYNITPSEQLLVVYDDVDLPFGKLRLRQRGSAGSHNGMKSIVEQLGSQNFPRLRVGIGQPPEGWDIVSYVLGRFTQNEENALLDICDNVADAIGIVLREGIVAAMNRYNVG